MLHTRTRDSLQRIPPAERGPGNQSAQQFDVLQQLAREIQQLETAGRAASRRALSSAGCAALDALLPGGGYAAGSVIEYLRATPACGASTLAWAAASEAMAATNGFLVVVDTGHHVYPPALASHGIDLAKVIFVRPQSQADALWAIDQSLRTQGIAAVVAELQCIDDRSARRLQLAAESGGGLAFLLRGSAARQQPSWAEVQWLVRTAGVARKSPLANMAGAQGMRRFEVQLVRSRGGRAGGRTSLEVDPLTGKLTVSKQSLPLQTGKHWVNHQGAEQHEKNSYEPTRIATKSALHLASQLAHTKGLDTKGLCRRTEAG